VIVTKCRRPQRQVSLADDRVARAIADSLLKARDHKRFYLLAWCVMPDHVHILLSPRRRPVGARSSGRRGTPLSDCIRDWARVSAHVANKVLGQNGPLWQEGFHDHAIRRDEKLEDVVNYIHYNPVRRSLADRAEDWPWSSAADRFASATDWEWLAGNPRD